jgi:hypothetical protein
VDKYTDPTSKWYVPPTEVRGTIVGFQPKGTCDGHRHAFTGNGCACGRYTLRAGQVAPDMTVLATDAGARE